MTARTQRQWWQPPRLHDDEDRDAERRVGWLELFYDLVFVVLVAEVAHYLSDHITVSGVLGYILLFAAIFWAWIGGTFYSERFETQDLSFRVFVFAQIVTVAAMSIFAHNGLEQGATGFALAYVANRVLLWVLWVRGGIHELRFRPVAWRYAIGFGISIACFAVSAFVEGPLRFGLWIIGLGFDFVTPITTLRLQSRLPRFSSSKLPERFGLFIIIVLGEAIVGTIRGVAELEEMTPNSALLGVLGIALAFGLWWVYFDYVARRPPRRGIWLQLSWNYLHLPLAMSIAAVGAAIENVVVAEESSRAAAVLLCATVACALLAIAGLELTLQRADDEPTDPRASFGLKAGAAAVAIGLTLWPPDISSAVLLVLLQLLLVVQMVYGAWTWFTRQPDPDAPTVAASVVAEES